MSKFKFKTFKKFKKAGWFVGFFALVLAVGGGAFYRQTFMKDSVSEGGADRTPQSRSRVIYEAQQELVDRVIRKGERDLKGKNLQNVSLRNRDFSLTDFSHADLRHANLQGSIFSNKIDFANFEKAKMQSIILKGDDSPADMVNFRKAQMQESDLSAITFSRSDFSGAILTDARLVETRFVTNHRMGTSTKLSGAKLTGADMTGSKLEGVKAKGANFQWAKMARAQIEGGDFRGADFRNVKPLPTFKNVWIDETTQFDEGIRISSNIKESFHTSKTIINYTPPLHPPLHPPRSF